MRRTRAEGEALILETLDRLGVADCVEVAKAIDRNPAYTQRVLIRLTDRSLVSVFEEPSSGAGRPKHLYRRRVR